jgi:D-glycero-D-manno-heptose 1,7-bisphosphate phosphatase
LIELFYFPIDDEKFDTLVIFDRDDTLIQDVPNLKSVSDIKWLPGRLELLKTLTEQSVVIAIATNQSAIGRGVVSMEEFGLISEAIRSQLEDHGICLWAIVACPHLPFEMCDCRKPKPGLLDRLVKATKRSDLNVFFVGNADSDMEAAKAASSQIIGVKLAPKLVDNFNSVLNALVKPSGL